MCTCVDVSLASSLGCMVALHNVGAGCIPYGYTRLGHMPYPVGLTYTRLGHMTYVSLGYMGQACCMTCVRLGDVGYCCMVSVRLHCMAQVRLGYMSYDDKVRDFFLILSTMYHQHNKVVDNLIPDHNALFLGMRCYMNDQLGS